MERKIRSYELYTDGHGNIASRFDAHPYIVFVRAKTIKQAYFIVGTKRLSPDFKQVGITFVEHSTGEPDKALPFFSEKPPVRYYCDEWDPTFSRRLREEEPQGEWNPELKCNVIGTATPTAQHVVFLVPRGQVANMSGAINVAKATAPDVTCVWVKAGVDASDGALISEYVLDSATGVWNAGRAK